MDKIIVKGKLVKIYDSKDDYLDEATIELSPPTPSEISKLKEGDEVLAKVKVCKDRCEICADEKVVAILPQPQQDCDYCGLPMKVHLKPCFPISACCNASVRKELCSNQNSYIYICEVCNRTCNLAEWNKPYPEAKWIKELDIYHPENTPSMNYIWANVYENRLKLNEIIRYLMATQKTTP